MCIPESCPRPVESAPLGKREGEGRLYFQQVSQVILIASEFWQPLGRGEGKGRRFGNKPVGLGSLSWGVKGKKVVSYEYVTAMW